MAEGESSIEHEGSRSDAPPGEAGRGWWDREFRRILFVLGALTVAVRLIAVFFIPRAFTTIDLTSDGLFYFASGLTLADGGGFSDAIHPPLWEAYLGLVATAGGRSVEQMGVAAGALGVLTVVLVALAGRRILSARAGLLAAAVVAVSPAFWANERNLNAEAITFPLIAATILLAYRYKARPTLGRCLALAAVLGLLALARSEQVLIIAVLFIPLVLGTTSIGWGQRVGRLALSGAVVVTLIAPWTIYNLDRFERPIILSAGSGNAMLSGACDSTFSGELLGGYDANCVFDFPPFWQATDRSLSDEVLRDEAIRYTGDHLDRLPVVVGARQGRTWSVYQVSESVWLHAAAVGVGPKFVWMQTFAFWATVPLAVAGTVMLRRRKVIVYPLLAFPATCVVSTAMTFGDIRYRAPAEIPILLLAAVAVDVLLARGRNEDRPADVDLDADPGAPRDAMDASA